MNVLLKRFWLCFKSPSGKLTNFGITAFSLEDAMILLYKDHHIKSDDELITKVEDVDVMTLDLLHVIPNMTSPSWRGIWYPIGLSLTTV